MSRPNATVQLVRTICWGESFNIFTVRVRSTTGGYIFSFICQSTPGGVPWDGVPPLPSQVRLGYFPGQVRMGGWGSLGWVTPQPGQVGVSPQSGQDGVPPPPAEMGHTHPPPPPQDRLYLDRLCRGRYASCGCPQEDFLVLNYF